MKETNKTKETVSSFTLEQYLLKELPAPEQKRLAALIQSDPALQKRIADLEASNQETLAEIIPSEISQKISERLKRMEPMSANHPGAHSKKSRLLVSWLTPVLVLPLALLIFWNPFFNHNSGPVSEASRTEDGVRTKGANELFLHRKSSVQAAGEGERLNPDAKVRPGDLLHISYLSAGDGTGIIFSVDASGTLTRHFPQPGKSADLVVGKKTPLEEIYELDETSGYEVFFFVTGLGGLDPEAILSKVKSLKMDSTNSLQSFRAAFPDLHITSFRVNKPRK